ncbi:MAG: hypothetical protein PF961_19150 [Planctomycetota bacterium]|jgi:hypothetical protein|nr:hypothetical protein [Planctomycetota bacterium]
MRIAMLVLVIITVLIPLGCGRAPESRVWNMDDTEKVSAQFAQSLLDSRWRAGAMQGDNETTVAIDRFTADTGTDRVDPSVFQGELERRLVNGGLKVLADANTGPFVLSGSIRRLADESGTWIYLAEATLTDTKQGLVAWTDAVQVRKAKGGTTTASVPRGGKSMATDRRQGGDTIGSTPAPQATNDTINVIVSREGVNEAQLLQDLAAIKRVGGVRSVDERVDERGFARLNLYVEKHREVEVRQRLLDMGWTPIRY